LKKFFSSQRKPEPTPAVNTGIFLLPHTFSYRLLDSVMIHHLNRNNRKRKSLAARAKEAKERNQDFAKHYLQNAKTMMTKELYKEFVTLLKGIQFKVCFASQYFLKIQKQRIR